MTLPGIRRCAIVPVSGRWCSLGEAGRTVAAGPTPAARVGQNAVGPPPTTVGQSPQASGGCLGTFVLGMRSPFQAQQRQEQQAQEH